MLSTFSKDKLSARKGCWKQFPTFGQGDVFVLPLSHAFVPRRAESIPCPGAFSVPAHLYCPSLQSLSWSWPRSLFLPRGFLWVIISSTTCKPTDTCWGNDWWKFSCLPAQGLCGTAPAPGVCPTPAVQQEVGGKPATGKVLETKINKVCKINQD